MEKGKKKLVGIEKIGEGHEGNGYGDRVKKYFSGKIVVTNPNSRKLTFEIYEPARRSLQLTEELGSL